MAFFPLKWLVLCGPRHSSDELKEIVLAPLHEEELQNQQQEKFDTKSDEDLIEMKEVCRILH